MNVACQAWRSVNFDAYWPFHLRREHERIHGALYCESLVLAA
jgi:hypothetical protein